MLFQVVFIKRGESLDLSAAMEWCRERAGEREVTFRQIPRAPNRSVAQALAACAARGALPGRVRAVLEGV